MLTLNYEKTLNEKNYKIFSHIKKGGYGNIYTVTKDYSIFAMKVQKIKKLTKHRIDLNNEIQIHSSLKHPNIVELYEHFIDENYIFMVLDYCSTDLYKHMQTLPNKKIDEINASQYLKSIVNAIIYCHSNDIIHRDLKTDNILIKDNIVKICDFGWSVKSKEPQHRRCGTLDYICPQIVNNDEYDYRCDIWCIGVLMYEMICGYLPFTENNVTKTYARIQKCDLIIPEYLSSDAKDLLKKILVINPNDRLSLENILKHPWITSI